MSYIFKPNFEKSEKNFDFNSDYRYYFSDFLKYGINLNKEDISWWEFDSILEAIMLDDKSCISKVITYRTHKEMTSQQAESEMKRHNIKMKHKYRLNLPVNDDKNYDTLSIMVKAVEKKGGVKNGK